MKVNIQGEEFELRKFTLKDREILENKSIVINQDQEPRILSGTVKIYSILLGCKTAPFFKSDIVDVLGVTPRLLNERLKEYYSMSEKYELLLNELMVAIKDCNNYDPKDAETIAKN